ncbi:BCLAF1 and THRAP3 family member 3 isoform X2 [Mugil cephalus]|uniref:BCLAF1 and THRAP3 family member 3 isoform X2 n=1 Tax=Mugil cephalus TaxID=48193 RepID=UPI001FB7F0CD|nr:BCLAF1 and THRAP3 family member 3 isoform X2 [Mugil cephalus]
MSRSHSRSPCYRRFPWEEPNFDPHHALTELDGETLDRNKKFREYPVNYFREDMYPEGRRRSSHFPDYHNLRHRPHIDHEEFYHRRPPPHHDVMHYEDPRLSPLHDGRGDGDRHRGEFTEDLQSFENRGRLPQSPKRIARERLPPIPKSHSDHQQNELAMGWRKEEQGRGRGRFIDNTPSTRSDEERAGSDRERGRSEQGPNKSRPRENPHHKRSLPLKRQRREMDDSNRLGYRNEEDFGEEGYSMDTHRDGSGGDTWGKRPLGDVWHSGSHVMESGTVHSIVDRRKLPRREHFDGRRDFDRQRTLRSMGFRVLESRLEDWEDSRECHFPINFQDSNYHETRRSPKSLDKPNSMRYGNRVGPIDQEGRGGAHLVRKKYNQIQFGRTGHPRNQPFLQQCSQGYQDLPHEEQKPGYQPFKKHYEDPIEGKPKWAGETQWDHDRPVSLDRQLSKESVNPKMPPQRERGRNDQKTKNMVIVPQETLTIKVDMSRSLNQNSSLCYSSDRQLSLDLVNVGRQRLDFLPMLEHSGTYQESAVHTGTFAQEIITLVHLVRDQYFRDGGPTLNERFSVPQKGGYAEEELEELTLDERFSSNRCVTCRFRGRLQFRHELLT